MSDVLHQSLAELQAKAKEKGLVLFTRGPEELFLDIDSPYKSVNAALTSKDFENLNYLDRVVCGVYGAEKGAIPNSSILYTKSVGGNAHIYIRLKNPIDDLGAIALQAALGSDQTREILSFIQFQKNLQAPTAFFETPEQAKLVEAWRSTFPEEF